MLPSIFYIYSKNKSENVSINVLSSILLRLSHKEFDVFHVDNPLQTSLPLHFVSLVIRYFFILRYIYVLLCFGSKTFKHKLWNHWWGYWDIIKVTLGLKVLPRNSYRIFGQLSVRKVLRASSSPCRILRGFLLHDVVTPRHGSLKTIVTT